MILIENLCVTFNNFYNKFMGLVWLKIIFIRCVQYPNLYEHIQYIMEWQRWQRSILTAFDFQKRNKKDFETFSWIDKAKEGISIFLLFSFNICSSSYKSFASFRLYVLQTRSVLYISNNIKYGILKVQPT